MFSLKKSAAFGLASLYCLSLAAHVKADDFAKKHPRRAQVLKRVKNEKKKNNEAAAEGKITQKQANKLNREDNEIHQQEKADAAANGGHISSQEQNQMNREENSVNRQRTNDEVKDAAH